jgi:hypothetical protein
MALERRRSASSARRRSGTRIAASSPITHAFRRALGPGRLVADSRARIDLFREKRSLHRGAGCGSGPDAPCRAVGWA